jgi:hypothetical protein
MELVHRTLVENIDKIKIHGLLSSKKTDHTSLTAITENAYIPRYLPNFVKMNVCTITNEGNNLNRVASENLSKPNIKSYIGVR